MCVPPQMQSRINCLCVDFNASSVEQDLISGLVSSVLAILRFELFESKILKMMPISILSQ